MNAAPSVRLPAVVIPEPGAGEAMHSLIARLYPICRSITGDGVRATLNIISEELPLDITEVPTGTAAFDWTIPPEWNIRDAYVKSSSGERVIDFRRSNLHVVGYSRPVHATMPLAELRRYLHTDEQHPDWIPYRTSYYREAWGFCLSHNALLALEEGQYEVCVDSSLKSGSLTYGEAVLQGESDDECLISCHVCHPSLCNDGLSGIAVAVNFAKALRRYARRYTYRFLFVPGTIGPIAWLSRNESKLTRIKHGLVLACAGDAGHVTYKRSRRGSAEIDRAVEHVLQTGGDRYEVLDFSPYGYDERQYCSPGIDLPVGCLMRTPFGTFPEYHTSADDLEFVRPTSLARTLGTCLEVAGALEGDGAFVNQQPKGEPQLGRRGLYEMLGGASHSKADQHAMLWVLNQSDGRHSLLDIARRAGLDFASVRRAADALERCGLLKPVRESDRSLERRTGVDRRTAAVETQYVQA